MQLIATGKWSKAEKRWKMLVAFRRPTQSSRPPQKQSGRQVTSIVRPRNTPEQ